MAAAAGDTPAYAFMHSSICILVVCIMETCQVIYFSHVAVAAGGLCILVVCIIETCQVVYFSHVAVAASGKAHKGSGLWCFWMMILAFINKNHHHYDDKF